MIGEYGSMNITFTLVRKNRHFLLFLLFIYFNVNSSYINKIYTICWGRRGRGRMVGSWISDYLCNQCLSPLKLWVRIPLRRCELDTTLCDKVCQWLATGLWFSPPIKLTATVWLKYCWNKVNGFWFGETLWKLKIQDPPPQMPHKKIILPKKNQRKQSLKWFHSRPMYRLYIIRSSHIFLVCCSGYHQYSMQR